MTADAAGGSSPPRPRRPVRVRRGRIGPWMDRLVVETRAGRSVRLHRFEPGAGDGCDPHDHPWPWFLTIVLRGGYDDHSPDRPGVDRLRAPAVRLRRGHRHYTRVHPDGALTLVITGPARREWGFHRGDLFYPQPVYARLMDALGLDRWAPCQDEDLRADDR